ncbi:MAG: trigger factor [bacterium]|nr:trigger factor [bacterium]
MKHTLKKLPDSIVELEVVLDHDEFLNYWQPVYDAALSGVHLKGFRPGTAPKDMAEKAVDKEKVFSEAANKAIRDSLQEINEENDWQLIDQPKVEVLESEKGLKFKATLTIFPEVKIGNYGKIVKRVISDKKEAVITSEELEKSINWVLGSRAKIVKANHEAKKGDLVEVEFSGSVDGKPLDGASGKSDQFILGEGKFIAGFEENIIGHKSGENLEFSVNFPKDYWKEDLRDKKVDFKVKVEEVFDRQLPELNDEFAKGLGKFETAEDLKKSIKDGIMKEKLEKEKEKNRLKIMEEIIKDSKIELPKVMVERTLDNLVAEYKAMVSPALKKLETDEEVKKRLEDKARSSVASNLVLYQIAKDQKLEPSQEEVEKETNAFLSNSHFSRDPQIDPQKVYDYSYGIVQNRKVFEYLESLK